MRLIPVGEASVLASLARFGLSLEKKRPGRRQAVFDTFFAHLKTAETREVAKTIRAIFRGEDVPDSRHRKAALGLIGWAFTNHALAHRNAGSVPTGYGFHSFNYPAALRAALHCHCRGVAQYRKVLRKFGELSKYKEIASRPG